MQKHNNILLVLVFGLCSSTYGIPAYHQRFEAKNPWIFLEETIITHPTKTVHAWIGQGGASLVASAGTGYLSYKGSQKIFDTSSKLAKAGTLAIGLGCGIISYCALKKYLQDRAERQQLELMMNLWPQVRASMPYEVVPSLDSLNNAWLNDKKSYNEQMDTTLTYLKIEVHSRFPSRYNKTNESFFTSRNLHVRVTLNLYKVAKKAYQVIKELLD